jgi:hypothetical protein
MRNPEWYAYVKPEAPKQEFEPSCEFERQTKELEKLLAEAPKKEQKDA